MKKLPKEVNTDIQAYIKDLDKRQDNVYLLGSREEEYKYLIHNQDRFLDVFATLDKLLPTLPEPISLLDIGVSPFTLILKKRYPQIKLYAIDYSLKLQKLCLDNGINFQVCDLNKGYFKLPKNKFNVVTFLEVIEHLKKNHSKALKHILGSLSKGGYCIIQTPNKYALKNLILGLVPQKLWNALSNTQFGNDEFSHFKEFSLQELTKLINEVEEGRILKAEHRMYFDTLDSTLIYRKNQELFKPFFQLNYNLVKLVSPLRRGMEVIIQKN